MTEQAPQMTHDGNTDYIAQYPDAIQDPAKAEEMAYASKRDDENALYFAKNARTIAGALDSDSGGFEKSIQEIDPKWASSFLNEDGHFKSNNAENEARDSLGFEVTELQRSVESAREKADEKARLAGNMYEDTKKADELNRGREL